MKFALITGSTKGIGKQIGIDLLKQDYFVYFNFAHDMQSASTLSTDLIHMGFSQKFMIIKANLAHLNEIKSIVTSIIEKLDVLILNAGATIRTDFSNLKIADWNNIINVNVTVPVFLIQALNTKLNDNARIIFTSSISGIIPDSVSISYGVSKAAINMAVKYLAKEFASRKITVNAVAPGFTNTDWHNSKDAQWKKRIADKTLFKRFASVEEISQIYLSIIGNSYLTGQIIIVDGGLTC